MLPRDTEFVAGLAVIEKSGGFTGFTTSVTVVEWVSEPLVPVIVRVNVPVGVLLVVWTLKVEVWAGGRFTDVGLSVQVVFAGQPLTVRLTVPLNEFNGDTVAV